MTSASWGEGREKPIIEFSAKEAGTYSLRRAILAAADNKISCFEREVSQTVQQAAKLLGESRSIFVPTGAKMKAALNITTATAGKETIATELQTMIEILRNRLVLAKAGVQFVSGLRGNVAFPRQSGGTTVNWRAESAASASCDATFDQIVMSPHKLTAKTSYTLELLSQSSLEMEAFCRNDIAFYLAQGIDAAGFFGSGVAPIPKGIANQTGVGTVAYDANNKFPKLVDMESQVAVANADVDAMAYVTTPEARGMYKKSAQLANTINLPIWTGSRDAGEVNGYKAFVTNNLPKNLGAGTNEHAMVFGDFSQCVIGEWGVLELIVDPYTRADQGEYVINARLLADIAVRHPQSFAVMTGQIIS